MVWQDHRHAAAFDAADIYVRDLNAGPERRLTSGAAYRANPSIWEHRVVWEDYRHGPNGDIYLFDLNTGTERAICVHPEHQTTPVVFGDWVLWLDYRNGRHQGDLYGYHLGTEQEHALLVHPAHQESVRLHGSTVVWQDYRASRLDLYRADLATPNTHAEGKPSPLGSTLIAASNPFSHEITLGVPGGIAAGVAVEVFDVLGRRVRHLTAAGTRVVWAGDDDDGRPLPSGPYVVRAEGQTLLVTIAR